MMVLDIDNVKKEEEAEVKPTGDDKEEGDKPKSPQVVIDANLAAERMEQANKKREELLEREEALAAQRQLGGSAEAGQTLKKEKETDEEYTARFERGEADPLGDDVTK